MAEALKIASADPEISQSCMAFACKVPLLVGQNWNGIEQARALQSIHWLTNTG